MAAHRGNSAAVLPKEKLMRIRGALIISALATVVLLIPGCTFGPISQLSLGDASLGLQGASATVPLSLTCDPGWNIAFGSVNLAQANGSKLAQGSGAFENTFPGVPCTGRRQTVIVTVFDSSPWVFRQDEAAVSGVADVFNPETGELFEKSVGPVENRIVKSVPQPDPARAAQPTRDPRFPHT
jgi:hypothetical protein